MGVINFQRIVIPIATWWCLSRSPNRNFDSSSQPGDHCRPKKNTRTYNYKRMRISHEYLCHCRDWVPLSLPMNAKSLKECKSLDELGTILLGRRNLAESAKCGFTIFYFMRRCWTSEGGLWGGGERRWSLAAVFVAANKSGWRRQGDRVIGDAKNRAREEARVETRPREGGVNSSSSSEAREVRRERESLKRREAARLELS